jgi:hypothetical protein
VLAVCYWALSVLVPQALYRVTVDDTDATAGVVGPGGVVLGAELDAKQSGSGSFQPRAFCQKRYGDAQHPAALITNATAAIPQTSRPIPTLANEYFPTLTDL